MMVDDGMEADIDGMGMYGRGEVRCALPYVM